MVVKFKMLIAGGAMLGLGGCALPPALEVASLIIGSGSWLVTGKGLTDHAVSAAVAKDCSMVHPLRGYDFCLPTEVDIQSDDNIAPVVVAGTRLKGVEHAVALAELGAPATQAYRYPVIADMNPDLELVDVPLGASPQIAMVPEDNETAVPDGLDEFDVNNLALEDLENMTLDLEMAAGSVADIAPVRTGMAGR